MPTRAERAAQKDVDMAVITLCRAARTAEKYKGNIGDGGAAARQKPDVAEVYSPPRVTAVAAKYNSSQAGA
eukprot:15863501-Heterocapsa_arctica.AAC.1